MSPRFLFMCRLLQREKEAKALAEEEEEARPWVFVGWMGENELTEDGPNSLVLLVFLMSFDCFPYASGSESA